MAVFSRSDFIEPFDLRAMQNNRFIFLYQFGINTFSMRTSTDGLINSIEILKMRYATMTLAIASAYNR